MNWSWNNPLKGDMTADPVLHLENVSLDEDIAWPTDGELNQVFPSANHSLKTWNRTVGIQVLDPHWIGVKKQTPLHYDPRYPRFTHQILLRVDGFVLRGFSKKETPELIRGTYLVVDTHSPHQLLAKNKTDLWYVAASIDDHVVRPAAKMIEWLHDYLRFTNILSGTGLSSVNGSTPASSSIIPSTLNGQHLPLRHRNTRKEGYHDVE